MEGQGKKIEESLSAKVEEQQKEVEEKLIRRSRAEIPGG